MTAAALAAVIVFLTGPRAPIRLDVPPGGGTLRGAFHIHTTRSDGALPKTDVARAAARAGLQFAVFTDHGDGTRAPDAPAYLHGVLCVDGVEISTNDGHYIALDVPAAPYPLGGDADAVVEDVARLGGFGVAAHPFSPRHDLAWSDWTVPVEGLEWLNTDSEWRDERRIRLSRALLDYLWRPAGALAALLDRPVGALSRWDELASRRAVVALAGHDAHGGFGSETGGGRGRRLHVPSYEATFRTFSIHATLAGKPTGDAGKDARALLDAIRQGRVFTAIDALAAPATLAFTATAGGRAAAAGDILPMALGPARFTVRARTPAAATIVLLRNGRPVAEASGGALDHDAASPGAYRTEIHVPGAPGSPPVPWLLSNPIYRFPAGTPSLARDGSAAPSSFPLPAHAWRAEMSPGSTGTVTIEDGTIRLAYRLQGGVETSQFAALVTDLSGVPDEAAALVFRGRSERPMRISVQLRFAGDEDARWRRSIYLDSVERDVAVPFERLRPADGRGRRPPASRATSALFVVDLTNARPGEQGSFALTDVSFQRDGS